MPASNALRHAFIANAVFSAVSGAAFILAGAPIARAIGLPSGIPLQVVGVCLLPFAGGLVWLARRPHLSGSTGRLISFLDAQWVLGTFVLLVGWPELFDTLGHALALSIAAVVAGLATWQLIASRSIVVASLEVQSPSQSPLQAPTQSAMRLQDGA